MRVISSRGPALFPGAWRTGTYRTVVTILLAAFALNFSGCVNTDRSLITGKKRAYGYTWAEEVRLGQEADASIIAQYGLYDHPGLVAYVDRIGQELVEYSEARSPDAPAAVRQTPFTFRILDSPVVNAFALPGGFVYVTRGLLAHMANEAQLAVVLGHEVGHVVGRHASIRAANQNLGQLLLIGGALGGQAIFGGNAAENILQGGSAAAQLAFLSYGRDDERESDDLGMKYAIQAGYDGAEAAAFFHSLDRLSGDRGGIPSWQSTHPDPGEREQTILRMAAEWEKTHPVGRDGRDALLAQVDGIIAGDDPRQGYTQNSMFYHPGMQFQFPVPQGYEVVNQASQVVLVARDDASVIRFTLESGVSTPREAAERFAAQEGLQVVQSGLGSSYGLPAQFVIVDAAGQSGSVTRARAHFVQYNGQIYAFLGLAARQNYASREQGFIQTMQGFAPLRDAALLNVVPLRLTVSSVTSTTTFASLVPSGGVGDFSPLELAILNQVELEEQIPAGAKVKLVR